MAIHRITVVHTISFYTIVYGMRFSVQISPRQLATGALYFSLALHLPRVFGLFPGLVYSTAASDGERRNEYLCSPTLSGLKRLSRTIRVSPLPLIERGCDRAADPTVRVFAREQRNERCTGRKERSLMVFYSRSTLTVCASGYACVSTSCRNEMER